MRQKFVLHELMFMAMLSAIGLFSKRLFTPAANLLTDFLRIPGGSAASGLSFLFLIMGIRLVNKRGTGTLMGLTQGFLAFFLGISGFQGIFTILVYTLPGITMDILAGCNRKWPLENAVGTTAFCMMLGMGANMTGSLLTNSLFFHLKGLVFFLWMTLSAFSGSLAGVAAAILEPRVSCAIKKGRS